MSAKIIDSHMHCGVQNSNLPFEDIERYLDSAGIQGACLFAPVQASEVEDFIFTKATHGDGVHLNGVN